MAEVNTYLSSKNKIVFSRLLPRDNTMTAINSSHDWSLEFSWCYDFHIHNGLKNTCSCLFQSWVKKEEMIQHLYSQMPFHIYYLTHILIESHFVVRWAASKFNINECISIQNCSMKRLVFTSCWVIIKRTSFVKKTVAWYTPRQAVLWPCQLEEAEYKQQTVLPRIKRDFPCWRFWNEHQVTAC